MLENSNSVRRVRLDDRDRVLDTIVAAFRTDPLLRWFFTGDDDRWAEQARIFFGALVDVRLAGGEAWLADAGGAVALWDPPGGCLLSQDIIERFWADVWADLGADAQNRVDTYSRAVDPHAPPEPRWYLGVLATHPTRWRRGLGRAVVQPVHAAADRAGLPTFLETATEENVRFYATLGYAIGAEVTLGSGGPPVWVLARAPGAQAAT